ncbi:MAG TPA: succinylglutamate desuccinylase/aspartoacylase family protein [Candidatus Dormibacteraeota bacterium]
MTPAPGTVARGMVSVPGVEPPWELPVVVVRGANPGPTFVITSGVHAAEYVPIAAVTEFTRLLDPATLRGTVIAVLIVNTPGFFLRSIYVNPRDGRNINRAFPGSEQGDPSERVAAFISQEVVAGADAYLDAHGGDLIEALTPLIIWERVGSPDVDAGSEGMANAFGLDYVMAMSLDSIAGTASGSAAQAGIPAITAEAGQQGICDPVAVAGYLSGLQRVAAHLGMIDRDPDQPRAPVLLREFAWLRADVTGVWRPTVTAGSRVSEGQEVGQLRDLFGEPLLSVSAGASGVVIFCVTSLPVQAGDPLLGIGVLASS